jgi:hypothetical protein
MGGAGGQFTLIIPSHNVVVVRLGHFKGESAGEASLRRSWMPSRLSVAPHKAVLEPRSSLKTSGICVIRSSSKGVG